VAPHLLRKGIEKSLKREREYESDR